MVKYVLSAVALKCFSATPATRRLYRSLGNLAGDRHRAARTLPSYYVDRVRRMVRLQREYGLVRNNDLIMEVGTGWMHWDALTTRLLVNTRAVLFDVWDNRQLTGLKNSVAQLGQILAGDGLSFSDAERLYAQNLIDQILEVDSFEQLYDLLGFEYRVEPTGSLDQLPRNSFQLIVSGGVLEHVNRASVPALLSGTFQILRPGGWAVHSIDIQDHLSYYDPSASKKNYLAFSERTWKSLFENQVQYINRIQRHEWVQLFEEAGFEIVNEETWPVAVPEKVADLYAGLDRKDLECGGLRLLLKKPA